MKYFVDTSVFVAAFFKNYYGHQSSLTLFTKLDKTHSAIAAHTLAEIYSTVTGMPKNRASPAEALMFLTEVRQRVKIVTMEEKNYLEALDNFATYGLIGGGIYDALSAQCALKAGAQYLFTWNVKDFTRLGADIASRVRTPDQS